MGTFGVKKMLERRGVLPTIGNPHLRCSSLKHFLKEVYRMRVVRSLFVLASVVLALALMVGHAQANTYASDVRVAFSGNFNTGPAVISFTLNDSATSVIVRIKQGTTVVRTITAGAMSRGARSVNWDGKNSTGGNVAAGVYNVEVETLGRNYSKWTNIYLSPPSGIFTRGGDINRNPKSLRFGHWYGGDVGGGSDASVTPAVPVAKSIREWKADGSNGGTTNNQVVLLGTAVLPASGQPWHTTTDDDGNIYFSDINNGKIYRIKEDLTGTRAIIGGVGHPRGIDVVGTGADRTIYFASDTTVFRFKIGTADTFTTAPEVVLQRSAYVRDVILDENGFLYICTRPYTTSFLDGGATGTVEKFNISGTLPKARKDTLWTKLFNVPAAVRPVGLAMNYGSNLTSNADNELYCSMSDTIGVFKFDLTTGAPSATTGRQVSGTARSANNRADIALDPAGNIVWWENTSEYLMMYAPPGAKSYITPNPTGQDINVTTPLPVELASFTVSIVGNGVELNWVTATETNNYGFDVQRSTDEKNFQRIGFVAGNGTTTAQHSYKFADRDLTAGTYYYRLKQMDTDGTITLSEIVRADLAGVVREYALMQNYPNPFNPTTTIAFSLKDDGFVKLRLFNMLGQQVAELVNGQLKAGAHTTILDARTLSSGTYLYVLEVNGFRAQKRLQIIK